MQAQTKVYATTLVSSDHVTGPNLGHDGLLATKADLIAKSNITIFPGYDASIELQFATNLPADTPSYIKITTEDNLLGSLIGGSLGSLISGLLGVVLTGNQEFVVEARLDAGAALVSGNSTTTSTFNTDKLRIVQNSAGEYLIRIVPDQIYNRIKITNKVGAALVGLGFTKTLSVYDAYYITGNATCGEANYTSFTASGALSLASTGVTNPQYAVTPSTTDFSVINMGLLAISSTIEQTVYYEGLSDASDTFGVRFSVPLATINAGIASNLSVIAYNGTTQVETKTLAQLLTLNLLTLADGQITTLYITPGAPVDRITIRLTSAVSVAQSLNFYGVIKTLGLPVITGAATAVCSGSTVALTATSAMAGVQFKWYSSAAMTTLLATTNSGVAFTTPVLSATTTYYVQKTIGACTSLLEPVVVTVVVKPLAGIIGGTQTACLTKLPAVLTSASADAGAGITYKWQFSTDQAAWTDIAASNAATYQPPVLTQATYYRRITINTSNGISCESVPTTAIKVSTRNCAVMTNPMIASRIKNGV